ncbi:hypothetical protein CEXT_252281 [Caerostris extrusa]|uniref:Ribosomal protein S14 n=1 Tax=Caerostris extrusa TaxID=172846 RepID=A0AAV4QPM8_CAEEX|nr:hypothetical protein CEXT_252281 [Caerostris extrusa]
MKTTQLQSGLERMFRSNSLDPKGVLKRVRRRTCAANGGVSWLSCQQWKLINLARIKASMTFRWSLISEFVRLRKGSCRVTKGLRKLQSSLVFFT